MALTPEAERLYDAFWAAADRLRDDPTVHGMDQPYFDQEMGMVDASGMGIPQRFWEHFALALAGKSSDIIDATFVAPTAGVGFVEPWVIVKDGD